MTTDHSADTCAASGAPLDVSASRSTDVRDARARHHAERNLGALVVAIEFTLISVMVGVVLFPLTEAATVVLRDLRFEYWPYIAGGLVLTLYLWTSVICHSLTFIGWPIDFGHSLLYITLALALSIQMHFITDPVGWFTASAVSAVVTGVTIVYDTRLIGRRLPGDGPDDALRDADSRVLHAAFAYQRRQLGLTPWYAAIALLPPALLLLFPDLFIRDRGHLVLVAVQTLAAAGALVTTIRGFRGWSGAILERAMAELESEDR